MITASTRNHRLAATALAAAGVALVAALGTAGAAQATVHPADLPNCAIGAAVPASLHDEDAGLGNRVEFLTITNNSATACQVNGYPTVQLEDTTGHALTTNEVDGSNYFVVDPGAHPVTVAPGQSATASIGWRITSPGPVPSNLGVAAPGVTTGPQTTLPFPQPDGIANGELHVTAFAAGAGS